VADALSTGRVYRPASLKRATLTVARSRGRRTKLGRGWSIPLASWPLRVLQAMHKAQGKSRSEWLFGRLLTVEQKVRDRVAKTAGMADDGDRGTLHRFRATMLAKLTEWGIDTETQQRLAGHASPLAGSRQHYIPPKPTPLMVEVAQRYADWVEECHFLY
jgi:Phage integrase family